MCWLVSRVQHLDTVEVTGSIPVSPTTARPCEFVAWVADLLLVHDVLPGAATFNAFAGSSAVCSRRSAELVQSATVQIGECTAADRSRQ